MSYSAGSIVLHKKTLENGWSRAMLLNFLETDLYDRQGKAISKVSSKEIDSL